MSCVRALGPICIAACVLVIAGCASSPPRPVPPTPGEAVIDAPRSERGNPNFYEVFGRRYYVMGSADGYRESGVASWYGRDFHGRSTSSGERYDMFALTAAHKTLPLPTWVEVTNRNNGRKIIVKVNDRGPFVGNRIIDLSYAAALELDMIGTGTAPVFVRALGVPATFAYAPVAANAPPVTASAPPVTASAPPVMASAVPVTAGAVPVTASAPPSSSALTPAAPSIERTFLQVGAYSDRNNASRVLSELRRSGVGAAHLHPADGTAGGVHRVHVGPVATEDEFDAVRNKLRALGYVDAHLVLERDYQ